MNATTKMNERTGEQTIEQTSRGQQAGGEQQEQAREQRTNGRREPRNFEWVPQALALVVVTPALIHAVMSFNSVPFI